HSPLPPPPRPTLLPYTTLFRSQIVFDHGHDLTESAVRDCRCGGLDLGHYQVEMLCGRDGNSEELQAGCIDIRLQHLDDLTVDPRSGEHTSELQSRENLVCRLLL